MSFINFNVLYIFKKWVFVLSFRSHFVVKIISLSLFKVFKNAFP
ncbi:hypothetical protein HMPREF1433_00369 [Helicobacter pylori GAMchJs117Ai]|nr:hypothetical protein HMPREF1433_00369 [Helicobacter pylori GAMchJs117Ai]